MGAAEHDGLGHLWALPMAIYLASPLWMMRSLGFRSVRWILMDLPSLVLLIFMGWGHGLLLATLWRLILAISSTQVFIQRGAQSALMHLLLLVLSIPVSVETSIRSTYLHRVWDEAELGLHDSKDRGWKRAVTTWAGTCGPDTASISKKLVFAGGSSTGSFNSYARTHIQYFPELIHTQLCEQLPDDHRLETINYGGGDRNTFTIARTIDQMLSDGQIDLFVLYGGVNDIFSRRHPMTRKQRHLAQQAQGTASKGLRGLSSRLRLVSGLSLPFRAVKNSGQQVSEVPLPDARENHLLVMEALQGKPLLLLTERVRASHAEDLVPYQAMQADLAAGHQSIHHLNLSTMLPQEEVEKLLADSPHYTQAGHGTFADTILPKVRRLLVGGRPDEEQTD